MANLPCSEAGCDMIRILFVAALLGVAAPLAWGQTLEPARLPGMCLTIDGAGGGSVSRECDGSPEQVLELPTDKPGPLKQGGECLEPVGGGLYPQLAPAACAATPAQTWTVGAGGDVRNGENRCMSVLGLSSRSGELVYAGLCPDGYEPQTWIARAAGEAAYQPVKGRIEWRSKPGLCLAWIQAGSFIGLAPCDGSGGGEIVFSFDRSQRGQVRSRSACLNSFPAGDTMNLSDCHTGATAMWLLGEDGLLSDGERRCAEPRMSNARWVVGLKGCWTSSQRLWRFIPEEKQD